MAWSAGAGMRAPPPRDHANGASGILNGVPICAGTAPLPAWYAYALTTRWSVAGSPTHSEVCASHGRHRPFVDVLVFSTGPSST